MPDLGLFAYIDAANKAVDKVTVAAGTALNLDVKFNNTTDKNITFDFSGPATATYKIVDNADGSIEVGSAGLGISSSVVVLKGKSIDLGNINDVLANVGTYTIMVEISDGAVSPATPITFESELVVTVTASVADADAAKLVVDEIAALGSNPTKLAVTTADGNYTALSPNAKTLVTNYATLKAFTDDIAAGETLETTVSGLDADSTNKEVADARAAYDALGTLGKAEVTVANITTAETNLANAKTALANKIAEAKPVYTAEKATLDSLTPVEVSAITARTPSEPAAYNGLVSALGAEITTAEAYDANADDQTVNLITAVTTALDGDLTAVTGAKAAFDLLVEAVRP